MLFKSAREERARLRQNLHIVFSESIAVIIAVKRGKTDSFDGFILPEDRKISPLEHGEGYKYLGVLEAGESARARPHESKDCHAVPPKNKLKPILQSRLNGNVMKTINEHGLWS